MLLPVLRAPLQVRTAIVAFFCALCLAATGNCSTATSSRAHRTAQSSQHRSESARSHTVHRASARRTSHASTARLRTVRHRAVLVRTRMPIRRYAWMHAQARRAHLQRVAETDQRETPAADASNAASSQRATTGTSRPVADAEVADNTDSNTSTAQEAADQIAAAETPTTHAELAAAVDPFRSTRIVAMAPLRGSLESLIRQNEKTNADNLERIEDDADLQARIAGGQLVRVPESSGLAVNPELPVDRRYCRPWTASFLADLSKAHEAQFHRSFEVSSAVRTVQYQKHLMRTNGNAAPAEGDIASPHLTGATIDIAKRGLTRSEIYWMRDRLNSLQAEGKIDVEEEFRQSCFHITVYKSYVGAGPAHKPHPHDLTKPDENTEDPATVSDNATPGI
ncbi:MAG: DUF5715 family protein [Terracidiphilus sp.]